MNQQATNELGAILSDFDRTRIVVREPGKRMILSSVEMGQKGDCAIEVRNPSGATIGFAFTKRGERYAHAPANGDGFIVCLGDSVKIVAIDTMGSVAEPEKGPEIITKSVAATVDKEAHMDADLYHAEQALVEYGTDNGKYDRYEIESHIPYATVVGCRISQEEDVLQFEVVQVGNAILYIIPLQGSRPLVSQNQTVAGRDLLNRWLTREEMLLSPKNKHNLTALGEENLKDPDKVKANINNHYTNQAIITDALEFKQHLPEKPTDLDFTTEGKVVILAASDAIDFMPSEVVVKLVQDTIASGGSVKDMVRTIISQSEAHKAQLIPPPWLGKQIQEFMEKQQLNFSDCRQRKELIKSEAKQYLSVRGKPSTADTDKAIQIITSQQRLLDTFGIIYNKEVITQLMGQATHSPEEAVGSFEYRVGASLEDKLVALDEIAYAKAVTGDVIPLKYNESEEAIRYFEQYRDFRELAMDWSERVEYLALLGKAFVRRIKPQMKNMGVYGEPDMVFLVKSALEMVAEIPVDRRQQLERQYMSPELFLDPKAYLERVYRDWVSANIITDDVTLVAFEV